MDNIILKEMALANIVKVEVDYGEAEPLVMSEVFTEIEALAHISEGEEDVLRTRRAIKATNRTDDLIIGFDLTMQGSTLVPEFHALIDGGTWDEENEKYTGPAIGKAIDRKPFTMKVFMEDKGCDGDTGRYLAFTFENCIGKPVNNSFTDGEFFKPEYQIISRPLCGASPSSYEVITGTKARALHQEVLEIRAREEQERLKKKEEEK